MIHIALALLAGLPLPAADIYFPPLDGARWERIDPRAAGWSAKALSAALDFAGTRRSTAVVALHRGRIIAERQWDPEKAKTSERFQFERLADGQVLEDVASVQKSVIAVLLAIARHKRLVRTEDPVVKYLGEGWSKAGREREARITLRHLATMTSGLAEDLTYEADPGTKWFYNTAAYQHLGTVLAKTADMDRNALTREWLTGPAGMTNSEWRDRGRSGLVGFVSTARDLARFGLLVLNGGVWSGRAVVPDRSLLDECLRSSQQLNPAYGYLWWLNGQPVRRPQGPEAPTLIPTAPKDLVAALGAGGRKVYVVGSLDLVVTRTGDVPDMRGTPGFEEEFWRLLMLAAPRQPLRSAVP